MSDRLGAAMEAELAEAPAAIARQRASAVGWIGALRDLIPPAGLRGIALTARGTSDHAAAYGRYLLEQAAGVPAWSTAPSLLTRYDASVGLTGVLAIAVSQSGRTPEIVTVLERQRAAGARTVAITNDPDSPLARAAHVAIALEAGPETAVPATKTFTATLHAFALMAEALEWGAGAFAIDGPALDAALAAVVADGAAVAPLATRLAEHEVVVHLGRGPLLPVAREAALKLIETTATAHLAWSTVDVRHGPLALAHRGTPVVLHHAPGPVAGDATAVASILSEAGVAPAVIGEPLDGAAEVVPVAGALGEPLRPLVHAIRIQQLALAVARARGDDPDRPAGLSKVTATT
jgi:glucosamine--fructose-6-phosphate aminotransferase (isomerizing)